MLQPIDAKRRTISQTFAALKSQGRIALMPFIPAGYPDLETTAAVLPALDEAGADLIEIGIPFSDPIADGPTIQAAFTEALAKRIKVTDILAAVASVRERLRAPLVAMVSYSIVFRYGLNRFLADAKAAGFDGLILPDLPPPEAEAICKTVQAAELETILLIAPTTAPERRAEIARLSSGFIYYLSISGITGARDNLPDDLATNLAEIKRLTDRPVCVGFGISKAEHLRQLQTIGGDGAIVGSALVKRMNEHKGGPSEDVARACAAYARELRAERP